MRTKTADKTARTFSRMIRNQKQKRVWSDTGTEFRGAFNAFCDEQSFQTYTPHSEAIAAFAQRNIRSLKILYIGIWRTNCLFFLSTSFSCS